MNHIKTLDMLRLAANQKLKEKNYWLNKLSGGLIKSSFPCDFKQLQHDKSVPGHENPGEVNFNLSGELYKSLVQLSKNSDTVLHMILTAGLMVLVDKYTNNRDIIVGTPIYKQDLEIDFLNTVVALRAVLKEDTTFKELLGEVRKTIMEAHENQNYPIEILAGQLNLPVTDGDDFPLFDIVALVENIHDKRYIRHIQANVVFSFFNKSDHIAGVVEYSAPRYDKTTIERIVKHFNTLLERVLPALDMRISSIDVLGEDEKKQLLFDFNDTHTDYPKDKTIHGLFVEQVGQTPDRIAVVDSPTPARAPLQITYRELDKISDRFARVLRAKGVKHGSIVGLMVGRSIEMIGWILGILKAGAGYLPLDPEFPGSRIVSMMEDCGVSILVTRGSDFAKYSFTEFQGLQGTAAAPGLTARRPPVKDFDRLPMPDRSMVDYKKYNQYIGHGMVKHSITMQATRGCPYDCAFCCRVWPRKLTTRSAENIFEEVRFYYAMGIRRFVFIDDIFNFDNNNSRQFFQLVIDNGLDIQILFPSGLRGDILTRDYIDLMVKAGTISFPLALETASPRLQKLIRKNLNLEKLRENVEYILEKYPHIILELHTIHGFPTETEEEAMMTLDFIKSLKYLHFPYVHILRIHSNTVMEKLAIESGISPKSIKRSRGLFYHELPDTLPFDRGFTLKYQSMFFNEYFLSRERLLHVLPYQMKALCEDEIIQKYNSYLPTPIHCFSDLLEFLDIKEEELGTGEFADESKFSVPDLNEKLAKSFPHVSPHPAGLKILLLDLSMFYSHESETLYNVVEQPLGLMYLMTYLKREFGEKINGKIAKSRIDFDNDEQLRELLTEFNPDVIGVRTLTMYRDFLHKTVSLIRQWGFDAPVITGGPYATTDYDTLLHDRNIDLVVLGEGEITFSEVIGKVLENGGKLPGEEVLENIPGLAFMSGRQGAQDVQKPFSREILFLDTFRDAFRDNVHEAAEAAEHFNDSSGLAYVIFTSGSTGKPKGIFTTHFNAVRVVRDTNYIRLNENDRILQLSNYAFDGSVFDIYGALLNGAALAMINREDVPDVDRLAELIKQEQVTVFFVTTALFNTLVDLRIDCFHGIRNVLFGGERISVEHSRRALEHMGKGRIIHVYGPTETTVYATYYFIDSIDEALGNIPIGKPISNTTIYILDNYLEPVPIGVTGEIYIGGTGVARGYLNNPELTAEKFIGSSAPVKSLTPFYRTGDLARLLPDMNIEFLGRVDHQVKIRGFRIELGEIENRLLSHHEIQKALVLEKEGMGYDRRYLAAYIVAGKEFDLSELREHLSAELPDYMIPSYFTRVEEFPLTPNGKIDIKALPDTGAVSGPGYIAPRNDVEEKLAGIWNEVLGGESPARPIGTGDNFFELGGHSLKATILVSKIHKAFNVKLPLAEIFSTPTIRGLADYILSETVEEKYESICPVEDKEYYELSPAQRRLYILQQMKKNSIAYNVPIIRELEGELDLNKFTDVFNRLIARHESLRTYFEIIEGHIVQRVMDWTGRDERADSPFRIEYHEFRDREAFEGSDFMRTLIRHFDLSKAPLMRVGVVKIGETSSILSIDVHHIITDGFSLGLLLKEFEALYKGKELPQLRVHYRDFAEWKIGGIRKDIIAKQEKYWLNIFEGEIPVLKLPFDYKRPSIMSFEGDSIGFSIGARETERLYKIADEEKTTIFIALLTIVNILLAKISGQDDLIIGTVNAGRDHADLKSIIGMFVNTIPLRNHPLGGLTFTGFLNKVKKTTLEAFENQDYPFEELVEKINIERNVGLNPVFDVMFILQNFEMPSLDIPGLKIKPCLYYNDRTTKFDLTLAATENEGTISFSIQYSVNLFSRETIERLAGYFKKTLFLILENREISISRVEIIPEEEKNRVLNIFNNTGADFQLENSIHRLFGEQVEKSPDNVAVIDPFLPAKQELPLQITYKELNEKSNRLAHVLQTKGVAPDTIVGVMAKRSVEMIIRILGVLKSGGAYLPIDPDYPPERIEYMLKDSGAKILLTSREIFEKSIEEKIMLNCELLMSTSGDPFHHSPFTSHRPGHLAYVIYTSGSTGKPKGVLIRHRGIINLTFFHKEVFNTGDYLRATQVSSPGFDAMSFEIWPCLLRGSALYIVPDENRIDPRELKKFLIVHEITASFQSTALAMQLMDDEWPENGIALRILWTAGDRLTRYPVHSYPFRFYNLYGPTEDSVWTTWMKVPVNPGIDAFSPIGKPIANHRVYILDGRLNVQPVGVAGELCIAGVGTSRGYLNNPELTAEKFIRFHRLSFVIDHSILYRTGDLARWLPDGNLEFLGRIDHQVKIRGFRIELGEIENRLTRHPAIKKAVVTARETTRGNREDKYLCAYIVLESGGGSPPTLPPAELREFLSRELPDHMIPSYFVPIDKIPLTPNGKIDGKALPEPAVEPGTDYIAPGDAVEEKLAEIWGEVLFGGNPSQGAAGIVGIDDNFFRLGGHSLTATVLTSRIHKELNVIIPLAELFKTPTVRGLSGYIRGMAGDIYESIMPVEEKEYYELSFAQKRMYILQQMDLKSTAYNMPEIIPWPGEVDIDRLEGTFKKLIKRHDSLRTSFHMTGDQPLQKVHGEIIFEIEKLDENRARRFVRAFDLSCAPLLRVGQLKTAGDRNYLLADMHHIISDGVSHRVLRDDFMALYDGEELPPLRIQYKDFAHWQHGPKEVERLHRQMLYWLKEFEGETPALEIPLDFPRPVIQSFEGDTIDFEISTGETRALNAAAKAEASTLFMLLLAMFNILLSKLGGREDITVGTPAAGRRHADLEKIIGMFVNTLAVRNYPGGELTFREFLRQVREKSLDVFENQEYPFEDLVDRVSVNRDAGRNPLFDVMFVLENFDQDSGGEYKDEPVNETVPDFDGTGNIPRASKFDMTLTAVDRGPDRGLFFTVQYCKKLFRRETVERFAGYFKKIISIIIEDPGRKLKEIEIISEEEKHRLLFDFNNTGTGYPTAKTIDRLFSEQVEKTPDTIAVVGEKDGFPLDVTYRELNERSGRLARYLHLQGVGVSEMVGIMANRSVDMIIGILGILAAGGAYVPLDPKAPASRINHILSECAVKVLLIPARFADEKDGTIFEKRNCILIDRDSQYADMPGGPPAASGTAADLAYVIFTSGSTGRPKGVPVTHGNLSPLLHWGYKHLGIGPKDRAIQNLSYYFDWSVWEIFITLTTGAGLHMVHEDVLLDPGACISYIDTHGITVLHVTPTQYRYLVNVNRVAGTLTYLFIGAEKLSRDLAKRSFQSVGPRCRVFNMYGPTECTIIAAVLELDRSPDKTYGNLSSIPIGGPVGNTRLFILDRYLKLCPVNTAGELYIGGDGAAAGYLNSPELTAERFNRSDGSYKTYIFYKTGDLARWLPDGNVEFLGRTDHQVKIRGFRIELGEIEAQIQGYAGIKEVVVLAKEDRKAEKYLCAYLVSDVEPVISELRDYLSKELPGYMIPSHFVPLEKIPLNPNGKIDLKGLPEPGLDGGGSYVPPRDEIERKLVDLWSQILRRDALHASPLHASPLHASQSQTSIGIHDDFFRLGGHSLNATVLVSKIHKELNAAVPLVEIFRTPTVKGLGEYIKRSINEDKYAAIVPVEKREYYALSPAQKRMYILQQMEPWNTVYNIPQFFPLSGDISGSLLEEVFAGLIRRHESLRTSFHMVENEPVQRVHDAGPRPSAVDVSIEYFHPDEIAGSAGTAAMVQDFVRPFDLSRAPLLRVGVVRTGTGGNENLLLTDIHHIVSDGTSNRVLTDDFTRLLKGEDLPQLRIQYKDFSCWQNSETQREKRAAQGAYWLRGFEDEVPVLNVPVDFVRPPVQVYDGDSVRFRVPGETAAGLKALALDEGATLYMVLLSISTILLSRLGAQEDIVVGTPAAGRRHADLEKIIGMFVNTLALRNYPGGEKTFKTYLGEVKDRTLEAFENQEYPFEDLVEKAAVKRDAGRNPLFDVMFTLDVEDESPVSGNTGAVPGAVEPGMMEEREVSKFDLTLAGTDSVEGLFFAFQYCTKLFKRETVERFAIYFKNIASSVCEDSGARLREIDFLPLEERRRLLVEFNDTGEAYPTDKTLHGLFEEQVEKTPGNIAVMDKETPVTYRELNGQADLIARHLIESGVDKNEWVGLLVHRSIEMIAGIIGILKAGCGYVPLNTKAPAARSRYILDECRVKRLVTNLADRPGELSENRDVMDLGNIPGESPRGAPPLSNRVSVSSDLAYVIFTSGSTGKPKGVPMPHSTVSTLLHWGYRDLGMGPGDRVFQNLSYYFDWSVWEIFFTLTTGARFYIVPEEMSSNPASSVSFMEENRISVLYATPSQFSYLLGASGQWSSLRYLFLGAETLSVELLKRTFESVSEECRVFNLYGPTETAITSTGFEIPRDGGSYKRYEGLSGVPIGVPVANTDILILDRYLRLSPVNVPGELYIGGDGLAAGYLNDPEKSGASFIKNIYRGAGIKGDRLYRTGDLARWLDGPAERGTHTIEFLGRIDFQVKIRGQRIELGEIENRLLTHELIKEAVVTVRGSGEDKYLCTYYVCADGKDGDFPGTSELREYLSKELPDYMIPGYFTRLEKIPLSPTGKVDRKALPDPVNTAVSKYVAPRDSIEEKLADTWSEILGTGNIGIDDDFFEVGGHSLKATILTTRIKNEFGVNFPLIEVFKSPTIGAMAGYIKSSRIEPRKGAGDNLVLLNKKSDDAYNIFFIHDGSGEVEGYVEFCRRLALGRDFNLWGIRADKVENYAPRNITIEETAANYIEKIKTIQDRGPYFIAGWSIGGTIAFEMANQLERIGEKIGFLSLIDSPPPGENPGRDVPAFTVETEKKFVEKYLPDIELKEKLGNVEDIEKIWPIIVEYLESNHYDTETVKRVIEEYEAHNVPDYSELQVAGLIEYLNTGRTLYQARALYIPRGKIKTPVHYFGAAQSKGIITEHWDEYCERPVRCREIDGDHFSIFKMPKVAGLAEVFCKTIDNLV